MWIKQRTADLSYKGAVGKDMKRLRMAGGRDVPMIPIVSSSNDVINIWFEQIKMPNGLMSNFQIDILFKKLAGFVQMGEINEFDMDAWVHASDNQLKIAILHWRGDADSTRDVYVLRTGVYWDDLT